MFKPKSNRSPYLRLVVLSVVMGGVLFGAACNSTTTAQLSQNAVTQTSLGSGHHLQSVEVISYRSPTCGCCKGWVEHMQQQGFQVQDNVVEDINAIKQQHGVPMDLASCHTALVADYVIEGHVPAADVQKLLAQQPNVIGIAAPGMPIGSPGMESGDFREPYTVFSFDAAGQYEAFSQHNS